MQSNTSRNHVGHTGSRSTRPEHHWRSAGCYHGKCLETSPKSDRRNPQLEKSRQTGWNHSGNHCYSLKPPLLQTVEQLAQHQLNVLLTVSQASGDTLGMTFQRLLISRSLVTANVRDSLADVTKTLPYSQPVLVQFDVVDNDNNNIYFTRHTTLVSSPLLMQTIKEIFAIKWGCTTRIQCDISVTANRLHMLRQCSPGTSNQIPWQVLSLFWKANGRWVLQEHFQNLQNPYEKGEHQLAALLWERNMEIA